MLKKTLILTFMALALTVKPFNLMTSCISISSLINSIRLLTSQSFSNSIENISLTIRKNTLNKKIFDKKYYENFLFSYLAFDLPVKLIRICGAKNKNYIKKKFDVIVKQLQKDPSPETQRITEVIKEIQLHTEERLNNLAKKTVSNHLFGLILNVPFMLTENLLDIISNKFLCDNTPIQDKPLLFLKILSLKIIAKWIKNPSAIKNKFRHISAKKILKSTFIETIETVESLASRYLLYSILFFNKSNYHKTLFNKNLLAIKKPFFISSAFILLASKIVFLYFQHIENIKTAHLMSNAFKQMCDKK